MCMYKHNVSTGEYVFSLFPWYLYGLFFHFSQVPGWMSFKDILSLATFYEAGLPSYPSRPSYFPYTFFMYFHGLYPHPILIYMLADWLTSYLQFKLTESKDFVLLMISCILRA